MAQDTNNEKRGATFRAATELFPTKICRRLMVKTNDRPTGQDHSTEDHEKEIPN